MTAFGIWMNAEPVWSWMVPGALGMQAWMAYQADVEECCVINRSCFESRSPSNQDSLVRASRRTSADVRMSMKRVLNFMAVIVL